VSKNKTKFNNVPDDSPDVVFPVVSVEKRISLDVCLSPSSSDVDFGKQQENNFVPNGVPPVDCISTVGASSIVVVVVSAVVFVAVAMMFPNSFR